jgi:hypothetical protein
MVGREQGDLKVVFFLTLASKLAPFWFWLSFFAGEAREKTQPKPK